MMRKVSSVAYSKMITVVKDFISTASLSNFRENIEQTKNYINQKH
jgi:F0F1-type ATP synthase gamma subunit